MKRTVALLLVLCLLGALTTTALADMGPKPSVVVDFLYDRDAWARTGQSVYYVTLLAREESTGPYSWVRPGEEGYPTAPEEIWQAFVNYHDPDGYHFLGYVEDCSETDRFHWGYYPPEDFKVLVYFPQLDTFESSITPSARYAFDSYYEVRESLSGEPHLEVERTYGTWWQLVGLLFRLVMTVAIELVIGLLFGYWRKKQVLLILGVNLATQLLLNLVLQMGGLQPVFLFYAMEYGALELGIFAVEAAVYLLALHRLDPDSAGESPGPRPVLYAAAANLASFLAGYGFSRGLPFLF